MFLRPFVRASVTRTPLSFQNRSFKTWRAIILPPQERPETPEEATACIQSIMTGLKKGIEATPASSDCLTLVGFPEFAFNGYKQWKEGGIDDALIPEWLYSAKATISPFIYEALRQEASKLMSSFPPGYFFTIGSCAIDTGKVVEGQKIGENRGFLCLSPSTSSEKVEDNTIEYTKRLQSNIDGWEEGFTVVTGSGPTFIQITDPRDNRKTGVASAICIDVKHPSYPIAPDLMFVSGAGVPNVTPEDTGGADLIVNDSIHQAFDEPKKFTGGNTNAWTIVQKPVYPVLTKVYNLVKDAGFTTLMKNIVTLASGMSPEMYEELVASYTRTAPEYVAMKSTLLTVNGLQMLISPEKPLPSLSNVIDKNALPWAIEPEK